MKSYVLEFAGSGEIIENYFPEDASNVFNSDLEALSWAIRLLSNRGFNPDLIVHGDWDADGQNDDGEPMFRQLLWTSESESQNDSGQKSIAQITKIGK